MSAAIPAPTKAPTIEWVVDTGKPNLVAMATQAPAPISLHTMTRIKTPGLWSKGLTEKMPLLMVPVTL